MAAIALFDGWPPGQLIQLADQVAYVPRGMASVDAVEVKAPRCEALAVEQRRLLELLAKRCGGIIKFDTTET